MHDRRRFLSVAALCGIAVILVGCNEDASDPLRPGASAAPQVSTSPDSSDLKSVVTTASAPTATATVTLAEESGFTIEVQASDCAASGNTIELTSPVSQTLTTDGCKLSVGRTWSFPGPHPASSDITFQFTSGFTRAKIRVEGSFPEWTFKFEDATDDDFDDIVLTVSAEEGTCKMFKGDVSDPLLENQEVLDILTRLAEKTNWSEDFSERFEQGGYLVRRDGSIRLVKGDIQRKSSCAWLTTGDSLRAIDSDNLVGIVHTHTAHAKTVSPNPGTCWQRDERGNLHRITAAEFDISPGPSPPDLQTAAGLFQKPSYILSPEKLYRLERTDFGEPVQEKEYVLNRGEDACIEN